MNRFFKRIIMILLALFFCNIAEAGTPAAAETDFSVSVNTVLAGCAFLLLIIIIVLGFALRSAILFYHQKRKKGSAKESAIIKITALSLLFLLLSIGPAIAQDTLTGAANETIADASVIRWMLCMILSIEVLVIVFFAKLIRFFTETASFHKAVPQNKLFSFDFTAFWTRVNRLKPIEEEASLDTGHSYDGIRELNNVTPPWFIAGFVISILCAGAYLWRYHVGKSAPLQIEEYNIAVAEAKVKLDEFLRTQANNVDENTVVVLDAEGIAAGQALFAANCVACHGDKGQGASVGPNLTDNYWLHKGGIKDIFKTIKYGWPEKGMKSWKDDFSPTQIAQLASYVHALKGSNPTGAKEPQGELYQEENMATTDTSGR